jgi:restriction endonuclease Mrr
MTVLDDLSGFEFEDVMQDVFRNLGYESVRQAARTADEGRDILMEEQVNGRRQAVVVECKHTDTVGRPVVQKLHSAVATFDHDGPVRGMVATTGRFTGPAEKYARELREGADPHPVELLDGQDLRELADEVGLDLYNGRIEILCDRTLRPFDPARGVAAPLRDAFRDIENIQPGEVPLPRTRVRFDPVVRVRARVNATFETSVGVVHSVDERDELVVRADRDGPAVLDRDRQELVRSNLGATVELDEDRFAEPFDGVEIARFEATETRYKEWAVDRLRDRHTTTVRYTGDNNVTYTKTCEPGESDVSVRRVEPVYLPRVRARTELLGYEYEYTWDTAGPSHRTVRDGVRRCVHCGDTTDSTYTFCANCGSISCTDHTETERLVGEPVCTGCAVTEKFFLSTKYFYDETNREQFRERYEAMAVHEKAMENKPLAAGIVVAALLLVLLVAGLAM